MAVWLTAAEGTGGWLTACTTAPTDEEVALLKVLFLLLVFLMTADAIACATVPGVFIVEDGVVVAVGDAAVAAGSAVVTVVEGVVVVVETAE